MIPKAMGFDDITKRVSVSGKEINCKYSALESSTAGSMKQPERKEETNGSVLLLNLRKESFQ